MARVARSSLPDGYFHIFARGVDSPEPLFRDDEDRRTFLDLLWRTASRYDWGCHEVCLLSTHYHLVLATSRERLSSGLHRVNSLYARHVNTRHGRFGHVFAGRFRARVIEGDQYLYDACEYVLDNPVRAGLCHRAEEWPWSFTSYGARR